MTVVYTAEATTTGGGRQGHAETSDGKVTLDLSYPKEMGGSGVGTNPEQLVALGYSACFGGALALAGKSHKVDTSNALITCRASLVRKEVGFGLSFEIEVELPGVAPELAQTLVAEAHGICPYSQAFTHGAPAVARLKSAQ
ncbi:Ohr family peroxiredoxin [Aquabacter cavernae]|uniref:Ohr family peroxiredoxin n=1 Tax=Aquabacter cavernae TaxID=2496029 RepID=UPI000F8CE21D|nr:Ohr family peroxiredoxin [Aquabacter cavernae]